MATTFPLTRVDLFPNGTSVGAYPKTNWTKAERNLGPVGAPVGSATSTKTMTSSTLTFTGLTDATDYYAVAQVGSDYVYTSFKTTDYTAPGAVAAGSIGTTQLTDLGVTSGKLAAAVSAVLPTAAEKRALNRRQAIQTAYFEQSYVASDVSSGQTNTLLSTGKPGLALIYLEAGEIVTNLDFASGNTAAATSTHCWAGLCDSSRALLAVSADDTAASPWAALTVKRFAMGSAYTVLTTGVYYAAVVVTATTVPTLSSVSFGAGLDGKQALASGLSSTTGLTTPSALATVFGAVSTNNGVKAWVGVS